MSQVLEILPQNEGRLRDVFGAPIREGSCVVDQDHKVGYVRLDLGPTIDGPDSAYWDGWFNVTATRDGSPWRGKAMTGWLVQVVGGSS